MSIPQNEKCAPAETGAHRNLVVEHLNSAASEALVKHVYPENGDSICLNASVKEMKLAFRAYEDALRGGDFAVAEAAREKFTRLAISVRRRTPRSLLACITEAHQFDMKLPPSCVPDAAENRIANLDRERRLRRFYSDLEGSQT